MPLDAFTISDSASLPVKSLYNSIDMSDMSSAGHLLKPAKADEKSCELPDLEFTQPLQDYGQMLGEELKPDMSDQQLGETFKQFAEKYGNEVFSATTDIRTDALTSIEAEFNSGLEGTGFSVNPNWDTNEMRLMKGDTDLGGAMFGCPEHYKFD